MTHPHALRASVLALCLAFGQAAFAQTDTPESRREAAQALIKSFDDLMGPERMATMMKGSMNAPMQQALQAHPTLTPAQRQRAAQVVTDEMDPVMAEMFKQVMPAMYAAMTQMYAERFTLAEIQELQRVYTSPTVRKATVLGMEELPRLMQPMMGSFQQWAPKMRAASQRADQRLRAEGIVLDHAQGKPAPAQPK
jgi:hypothetical protein